MTERYTGIPENQKIARAVPERRQFNRQQPEASYTASSGKTQGHTEPLTLEVIRRGRIQQWRAKHPQTWEDIESMATFRERLNEKIDRMREKAMRGTQEGGEKVTVGQLLLLLILATLSAPMDAAKQQAEQAA